MGRLQPPSLAAAAQRAADSAGASLQGQEGAPAGGWPAALRQMFAAAFQAQDALEADQNLAAACELCSLAGCAEPEAAAARLAQDMRCSA